MMTPPNSLSDRLVTLRDILLALNAAGDDGFEGLVATALANMSGLTIRLSKSGSQYGRDGKSQAGGFAIAMEAKRYQATVPLQELAGKASLAAFDLAGDIDVWVLGATVEVGEATEGRLRDILEKEGITLLPLDWTAHPLPRLAVLLAAVKSPVLRWFSDNVPSVPPANIEAHLDAISGAPAFASQLDILVADMSAATVGLDALREKNEAWLGLRLKDRARSQESFGQYILVSDTARPAIDRPVAEKALKDALSADDDHLIAVLGEEGTGKTWLTTKVWAHIPQRPILVLVSGRRANELDVSNPRGSLARLLADQDGNLSDANVERWRRRLDRWASGPDPKPQRFILVFDGVNEHANLPWSDLLKKMSRLAKELGGKIIVTSRPGFWRRDIAPRLGGATRITDVKIGDYSDAELEAVLARDAPGVSITDLSPGLKKFMRNPRICAVAIGLLDTLRAQPEDLTRERLLIEYWRHRLEERGNLLSHNLSDFDKLLRSHAKAWLESRADFDRDDWTNHSGAAKRLDPTVIIDDLTEIEEGRFLNLNADDDQRYGFRLDSLPYALGLLIIEELKTFVGKRSPSEPATDPEIVEQLEQIIEPVQAWDLTSGVLAAAICLSYFDPSVSDRIRVILTRAWFELQNVEDEAYRLVMASSVARPEIVLDVLEHSLPGQLGVRRRSTLTGLLVFKRDHLSMRRALEVRLPRWLARWTRQAEPIGDASEDEKRQAKREAAIEPALKGLKAEELSLFRELTNEQPTISAVRLIDVAAMLIASRPLAPFAGGLFGWAFIRTLAPDLHTIRAKLAWVLRLNRCDRAKLNAELLTYAARLGEMPTEAAAGVMSEIFSLQGDPNLAEIAEKLQPPPAKSPQSYSRYFAVDPFDPDAQMTEDLEALRARLDAIAPQQLWRSMSLTSEDDTLDELTPLFVRFDPERLIAKINAVVATGGARRQMLLRQLGWHVPQVSAALTSQGVASIAEIFDGIIAEPDRLDEADRKWTPGQFVESLNPHLDADGQIGLLQKLPPDYAFYLNLRDGMRPLEAEAFAQKLASSTGRDLLWVLFHAAGSKTELNAQSRAVLLDLFFSEDETSACFAAEIAIRADDDLYFGAILQRLAGSDTVAPASHVKSYAHDGAIAAALHKLERQDAPQFPAVQYAGSLCEKMGGVYVDQFVDVIDASLGRLLKVSPVDVPADIIMHGSVNTDGSGAARWAVEREIPDEDEDDTDNLIRNLEAFNDPEHHIKFGSRQREIQAAYKSYVANLKTADLEDIVATPSLDGWARIVSERPSVILAWAEKIANLEDHRLRSQVRNLAIVIARSVSFLKPELSAQLFRIFKDIEPPVSLSINSPKIAVFDFCLYGSADVTELQPQKEMRFFEAMTDAAIEKLIVSCEHSGADGWLDRFVAKLISSGQTPDIALAFTIAGFRTPNAQSDVIFAQAPKAGFLGIVQEAAEERYTRAKWARHWYDKACQSLSPPDFWRYSVLAAGIADMRHLAWLQAHLASNSMRAFLDGAERTLLKEAGKRSKDREKTLYGLNAPDDDLRTTLKDIVLGDCKVAGVT